MFKKGLVLGGHIGVDECERIFIIAQLDAPFARITMNGGAIIAAHVSRQRRFISFKAINRWQVTRKGQPNNQPADQEKGKRIARQSKPSLLPTMGQPRRKAAGFAAQAQFQTGGLRRIFHGEPRLTALTAISSLDCFTHIPPHTGEQYDWFLVSAD